MPNVIVTFEGLMLFRRDRQADVFDVGLLDVKGLPGIPDHLRRITAVPNPIAGLPSRDDAAIAALLSNGNVWNLDVVDASGNVRKGIKARTTAATINRLDTDSNQHDFAWLMNMDELHRTRLPITPGHLKPIIRLSNGLLTTIFKTDGINLLQGAPGSITTTRFGFVGETAGLEINLQANEALVLRVGSTTIFEITVNSSIAIENVMPPMTHPMPGATDHFQAYYSLLFPSPAVALNDRFRLELHQPTEPSPNHPAVTPRTIEPFKCGGITTSDGDGPLG